MPRFAADERRLEQRYPLSCALSDFGLDLRYRLSRPSFVAGADDAIIRLELFGWLKRGRQRVGAFELATYDPNGCSDNEEFIDLMDADTGYEADLSCVLSNCWRDIVMEVTAFGPILSFQSAWISQCVSQRGLLAAVLEAFIVRHFANFSILVLKPFPLEYEGRVDSSAKDRATDIRQKAMIRYYSTTLGVDLLPGCREPWMWRPSSRIASFVTRPRMRRRKR